MASIFRLDFSPRIKPFRHREQSVEEALAGDWQRVGDDLRRAMGMNMEELKYWGFAETLGPVLRRRFRGTEQQAQEQAQQFANQRAADVDYWDEADKSARPGSPAVTLRTVNPLPLFLEERRTREAKERAADRRKTWH
jgi:hypothetical protein